MGAIYQSSARTKARRESDFSGGINTGVSIFDIGDNETTEEFGFDTDNYPARTTRKGRTTYGASGAAVTYLLTNFGNTHMVRAVGTALQYDNAGTWTAIPGTFTASDWDSTNFNGKLLLTNGTDNVKQWSGSALSDLNATDAPKGKYITNDINRVWVAKDDILYWSKFLDETDWTATEDAGSVQYYTPNGGDITALRRFYDNIVVFKKNAMAVIQGKNYFNFALTEVSDAIGCVSFKTLQEVGDTLFWLGETDVYAWRGGKPTAIGDKVRSYLNNLNKAQISKCSAFTDGIRYYLCLVTGSNTEPDTRLVFDPRFNVWRIPALSENYRYGVAFGGAVYVGDSAGQTYKELTGTTNNGTAISWSLTTKPFDEGYPEAEKEYKELHMQGYFPSGTTLSMAISINDRGSSFTTLDYDPSTLTDTVSANRTVIIPLDTVSFAQWSRYKFSGTGPVEMQQFQRYFKTLNVQR